MLVSSGLPYCIVCRVENGAGVQVVGGRQYENFNCRRALTSQHCLLKGVSARCVSKLAQSRVGCATRVWWFLKSHCVLPRFT